MNPAAEARFGYTAADVVGRPIDILVPDTLKPQHRTQDREDRRVGRLSDEGRAWEVASQQRERDARDVKLLPRA